VIDTGPKFHPLSPVQPGRSPTPFLVIAILAALAVWTAWQNWPDREPPSSAAPPISSRNPGSDGSRGDVLGLVSSDDYPQDALDRNEQGTTSFRLDIDARGRVTDCTIVTSSGSESLDSATCRIMKARARFRPAADQSGRAVASTFSRSITWRIADSPGV
jgi:protein TonB